MTQQNIFFTMDGHIPKYSSYCMKMIELDERVADV